MGLTDPAPPTVTILDPVRQTSGKFKVEILVSSEPNLKHRQFGDTAEEADSLAREFRHSVLSRFYRSLAAKHHRAARRIATARERAAGAAMEGQAA